MKAEVIMQDGKGDQATQNDQLDVMIEKGVDVLAVNMVDAKAAAKQVMKDGETIAEKYEAQQTLYEAIKHLMDSAQSGSKSL